MLARDKCRHGLDISEHRLSGCSCHRLRQKFPGGYDVLYNDDFFELIEAGSLRSARRVIPEVLRLTQAKSVVDFGCGVGTWLAAVQECGIEDVVGIDGTYVSRERLKIPASCYDPQDLTQRVQVARRFDLAVCLEVAEHLPESRADSLIEDIARTTDAVLFSAAIPGQFGTGHINEQWPDYWAQRFLKHGFFALDTLRERFWSDPSVETHYKQNSILYLRGERYELFRGDRCAVQNGEVRRLIHPNLYEMYVGLSDPFSSVGFRARRVFSQWAPTGLRRAVRALRQRLPGERRAVEYR
jgi:SAM-dependent methyltransferase